MRSQQGNLNRWGIGKRIQRDARKRDEFCVYCLTKELQDVLADEKKQLDSADSVFQQATASALKEKQRVDQQEGAELNKLQITLGVSVSSLSQQLNQSRQGEDKVTPHWSPAKFS